MTLKRKMLGRQGEELAACFLEKNRFNIVCRNYTCVFGEIDIIAQKDRTVSFIEVKTRTTGRYGKPQEAIHLSKQKKISRAALEFIQRHGLEDRKARFDVITVQFSGGSHSIEFIENAFDLIY